MEQVITAIWRGEGGDFYERDYAIPHLDAKDSIAYALIDIHDMGGQVLCLMVNASAEQKHLMGLAYQPRVIASDRLAKAGMMLINEIANLDDEDNWGTLEDELEYLNRTGIDPMTGQ
jgi:hypothetical protein